MFKIGIIGLHHLHSEGYIKLLKNLDVIRYTKPS